MALLQRVSRLITADVHAVLDRLEEPREILRQSIRDMEDRLAALDARIRRVDAGIAAGDQRLTGLARSLSEADSNLDLCFAERNDTLARRVVRRKLELTRLSQEVRRLRDELVDERAALTALAGRRRDSLAGLRDQAALLLEPGPEACDADEPVVATVDDTEIEIALLAERDARQRS